MADAGPSLVSLSTRRLLRLYDEILTELLTRHVVRSRNAPAGDLAEMLVARAYGGELADPSTKSWDVLADGRRLQVKCRVMHGRSRTQFFSPFRSWDFDACVFVTFDGSTYDVSRASEVEKGQIRMAAHESVWVRGHRVTVAKVGSLKGRDVTALLQSELERL
jgi:hypothetical protein